MLSYINKFAALFSGTADTQLKDNELIPAFPLKKGENAPQLTVIKNHLAIINHFGVRDGNGTMSLTKLFSKPLVVAFYSSQWKDYGLQLLKELHAVRQEINLMGGELVVITGDSRKHLSRITSELHLSLSFMIDEAHHIAEKFGIYTEEEPIWKTFSGIDKNVPYLSVYAISAGRKIIYDYVNDSLWGTFSQKELLTAVLESSRLIRS